MPLWGIYSKICVHGCEEGKCEQCYDEHVVEADTCRIEGHYCKTKLARERAEELRSEKHG